ncbi:MAG: sodium/proline symporter PutP [Lachnospiraceae bacterium]|nr:sodium/proline symporter PutP [Lachnospiraceae bacterium]
MTTANICILIAIIAYLLIVVGIGVFFAKGNETTEDFYLGGRKLGPFVTAMSAEASDMSSYLLMGVPGVAYATGLADATWTVIGLAVGTYLNWLIVAKRLRKYTVMCNNSTTVPVFFSNRYRDEKKMLSVIAAVVIIVFFIPYTASGFSACGKLFNTLFGADYHAAMIVSAFVIITYTTLGGFMAASTSDFIQSIVMTIALCIIVVYGCVKAGGVEAVVANAETLAGYFKMTQTYTADGAAGYGFLTICSTLAWGLGYFGMPHILLRFMAIEDPSKIKLSRRIATVWVVISMFVAVAIGIIGRALSANGVIPTLDDGERVIIALSQVLSEHGIFPALIAGVIMAGILAATMSTADSQLLAASSSVSQNIVKEVFFKNMKEQTAMLIARITVVIISVIAVIIAWNPDSSVFSIVSFAWAGFGAAFGPTMLLALFWKRSNKAGALAGMIAGGAMVFIWKFLVRPYGVEIGGTAGGALNIYELLPAFIVALVVNVVVALLTKAPSTEITDEFEAVNEACKM